MTPQYLVDTDWVIHYLNNHSAIRSRLEGLSAKGHLAVSILTLAELYEGLAGAHRPDEDEQGLKDFLAGVSVLDVDDQTCRIFAQERGRLRKTGKLIGDFDLMIGATAVRHGLVLLSNNRRHFERISGLEIESA